MTLPFLPAATAVDPDIPRTTAISLPNLRLSDDEQALLGALKKQLTLAKLTNRIKNDYYEDKHKPQQFDIAIPPQLRDDVTVAVGWPGTVVDVLEERIDLLGYTSDGDLRGLDEIADDNYLDVESSRAHCDSLIAGISFVSVGKGDPGLGEPEVVISAESPSAATLVWDYRKRAAAAAISQTYDDHNRVVMQSFYLPDKTVKYAADPADGRVEIIGIDQHNLHRVLMTRLINRDRATDTHGRSEITRAIRYYTDAAVRTMLGMEINREFYTTPQRFALNVNPESLGFTDGMSEAEKQRVGWQIMMGHMNVVPPQPPGPMAQPNPTVQQFTPAPPTPYIEQVKAYSIQVASASGLPATMLGFVTDNPTSGDAITKSEFRLVRRAERRIQSYNQGWREVALLALLCRDGTGLSMSDIRDIRPEWRNPAVPTRAAAADEAQKLVAAEVLPPRSTVTWTRLGITPREQRQLEIDWRKRQAEMRAEQMQAQAQEIAKVKAVAAARPQPSGGQPGRANVGGGPSA